MMNDLRQIATTWKQDLPASLVVFLVALPLCMGIAIASGVPVYMGLITGIVGGLVVGLLSGAPLQVSGPAAGLTVVVYGIVQELGLEVLGIAVLLCGVLQIIAGLCRLGQWFRAVSPAVVLGMLGGIGVLIFAGQFHVMVDDKPPGGGLKNLLTIPEAIQKGLPWPELEPEDKRRFHTEHLKQIGNLHVRQVDQHTAVAKHIARVETPGTTHDDLMPWLEESALPEQQAILAKLEKVIDELDERGFFTDGRRAEQRQAAAKKAREATEEALEDLDPYDPQWDHMRESSRKAEESLRAFANSMKNHDWAAKIGILTILIIVGWQSLLPKKWKLIPAPLVAISVVTGIATVMSLPVLYVEVPDNILNEISLPTLTTLRDADWPKVFLNAIVLACIASAETLLCAVAVDQMHQGQRTKYDRELWAQGVGNTLCGLLGGLPMTGVIVRSSANIHAGGQTRLSAILHGFWLLLFVAFLGFALSFIPQSALAAMLVYTGYKLVNIKAIRGLWHYGKSEVAICIITMVTIVTVDLLTGVILGIVLSAIKLLSIFSHLDVRLVVEPEKRMAALSLHGAATFLRLPRLAEYLEQVPAGTELHVDLEHLDYIDHACLNLLMTWSKQHEASGGQLVLDWDSLHANFRRERAKLSEPVVPSPSNEKVMSHE